MKFKFIFLILNILVACLISFPIIFCNEAGGSGGDSDSDVGGDGGDDGGDSAESAGADAEASVNDAAAEAGVDASGLAAAANAAAQASYGVNNCRSSFSASVDTPAGTVSATGFPDPTSPTGFSVSFSVTTKTGKNVAGTNGVGGFGSLADALGAQAKANAAEAKSSFWSGLFSIFGFIAGLACSVCGIVATAVAVTTTVYDMVVNKKSLTQVVSDKIDDISVAVNSLVNSVNTEVNTAIENAYAEVKSEKAVKTANNINAIVAEKDLPYESKSSTFILVKKDSRDAEFPVDYSKPLIE